MNMSLATWYEGTAQLSSLTELKPHIFLASFHWLKSLRRGGNRSTWRKPMTTRFKKCYMPEPKNSSPKRDLYPHSSNGGRRLLTITPRMTFLFLIYVYFAKPWVTEQTPVLWYVNVCLNMTTLFLTFYMAFWKLHCVISMSVQHDYTILDFLHGILKTALCNLNVYLNMTTLFLTFYMAFWKLHCVISMSI